MVVEILTEGKDVVYDTSGEIIEVNGEKIAKGPSHSKTTERQIMLNGIAGTLDRSYTIMRFPHKKQLTKYELWYAGKKYALSIYIPAKQPKAGPSAYLPLISAIAAKLDRKVYLNMVELYPGAYLKLTLRRN